MRYFTYPGTPLACKSPEEEFCVLEGETGVDIRRCSLPFESTQIGSGNVWKDIASTQLWWLTVTRTRRIIIQPPVYLPLAQFD